MSLNPALITAILSVLTTAGTVTIYLIARGETKRLTESRAVKVTIDAAENVVEMMTGQLKRAQSNYDAIEVRVGKLEEALEKERGQTENLRMQLGKMRKRVGILEDFIRDLGQEPPPHSD